MTYYTPASECISKYIISHHITKEKYEKGYAKIKEDIYKIEYISKYYQIRKEKQLIVESIKNVSSGCIKKCYTLYEKISKAPDGVFITEIRKNKTIICFDPMEIYDCEHLTEHSYIYKTESNKILITFISSSDKITPENKDINYYTYKIYTDNVILIPIITAFLFD
jgi:hypothetical protein